MNYNSLDCQKVSAAKYSVDGESLANELQQFGLPKGKLFMSSTPNYSSCIDVGNLCHMNYSSFDFL